jgi:large subunit ribosomal protein L3
MKRNVKAILGEKLGMTQVFADDGSAVPVTVLRAGPCTVTQIRTEGRDGYAAVQIGFGEIASKRLNKPETGHLAPSKAPALRSLVEIRTEDASTYELGAQVRADVFAAGDMVDVVGVSKGKGFAGAMKRWNFSGKEASHGTERKHRSPGSVNAGTTPGRVFKGKKLPGHLGHERVTVLSLQVVEADPERNLLLIRGAVPGPNGGLVLVRNAFKAPAGKKS